MHTCSNCYRHIRDRECPFCHTVHDAPPAPPPAARRSALRQGLQRGALVATVVVSSGCAVAAYGVPIGDSGPGDSATMSDAAADDGDPADGPMAAEDAAAEDTAVTPAYGIPADDAGGDR